MLKLVAVVPVPLENQASVTLTLPYERRIISRQRVTLDDGSDAGLFLPRGSNLPHGTYVQGENGEVVQIKAASETVSTLYCDDALLFARACYHLGNRHVPLEISAGRLRYLHDHVLDDLLHGLGLHIVVEQTPFEPESGAYAASHSHHHSGHQHDHEH